VGDLKSELLSVLTPCGQEHVLRFWDDLSAGDKEALYGQAKSVNVPRFLEIAKSSGRAKEGVARLESEPFVRLPSCETEARAWEEARLAGQEALCAGKVAAMVVAGGQGTRLGFNGPKGAFPIGPVTRRTLFQVHAEKVLAASRRYGRSIPLLVITGPSNDAVTRFFLKEHNFFGLPFTSVRIFQQGELPALDDGGRIVMDKPGHMFTSPNGHGGSLKALWDSGTIEWLEGQGIEFISYFQVDNPLVRVIDPSFIGLHVKGAAEMSLKLVARADPDEKLGIWVRADGKAKVIEYSDMPKEEMHATDGAGALKYAGGSIAIHCFSVGFVRRLNEEGFNLPCHRARKKVPYVDGQGRTMTPEKENGTKFEMFVFDAIAFAKKTAAVETSRAEEFSPVKNAAGNDSPETARRDMSRLYGRWLTAAGVEVPLDGEGYPVHGIEISPLVAGDAAELAANYRGPGRIAAPFVMAG